MKIKFFKPEELEKPIRLSVHRSGKLGFSKEAEIKLNLPAHKYVGIGENAEDEFDNNLYMVLFKQWTDGAFNVSKAGDYYYVNTRLLFDNLKINYKEGNVVFEMSELKEGDQRIFKLERIKKEKLKTTHIKINTDENQQDNSWL